MSTEPVPLGRNSKLVFAPVEVFVEMTFVLISMSSITNFAVTVT